MTSLMISVLLVLDFDKCIKTIRKYGCYLSALLTGDLQKLYSVFRVLPFLHRSAEFYQMFTQPLQIIVVDFVPKY